MNLRTGRRYAMGIKLPPAAAALDGDMFDEFIEPFGLDSILMGQWEPDGEGTADEKPTVYTKAHSPVVRPGNHTHVVIGKWKGADNVDSSVATGVFTQSESVKLSGISAEWIVELQGSTFVPAITGGGPLDGTGAEKTNWLLIGGLALGAFLLLRK